MAAPKASMAPPPAAPPPGPKKPDASMQFQIEADNELQWRSLLRREGLILIDCYASWAGPCTSMVAILKRVKVEVNDERLWYGMACSDNIDDLSRFKDQSEPCWLFFAGGKPIKVLRGSNVPILVDAIKAEFAHELECLEGKSRRNFISIDDPVSRKQKQEAEAAKLAKYVAEQDEEAASSLNALRRDSSLALMNNLDPYSIAIIQPFVVEAGQAKEIVDYLAGDFKIVEQVNLNMTEDHARKLYKIPYAIPDPNATESGDPSFPTLPATTASFSMTSVSMDDDASQAGDDDDGEPKLKPKKSAFKSKAAQKMLEVPLPDGLQGECVVLLLEHEEIKELAMKKKKPEGTLLQTADDWLRMKVGPMTVEDATTVAPYTLVATYGKQGDKLVGVYCPRSYEDKRFILFTFFPTFMQKLLEVNPIEPGKYAVTLLPSNAGETMKENMDVQSNLKDIRAEGKVKIPEELAKAMLKSHNIAEADSAQKMELLTSNDVYAVSFNPKNQALRTALAGMAPVHVSKDENFGRQETIKIFPQLNLPEQEETSPEQVIQKFLARSTKRIVSLSELNKEDEPEPVVAAEKDDDDEDEKEGEGGEGHEKKPSPSVAEGGEGEPKKEGEGEGEGEGEKEEKEAEKPEEEEEEEDEEEEEE